MHLVLKVPGLRNKPPLDPAPAGTPQGTLIFDPASPHPVTRCGKSEWGPHDIECGSCRRSLSSGADKGDYARLLTQI
jgi:hypothetical protein